MTTRSQTTANFARLRWLCRRGMLELDLMLAQFLDNCFLELPAKEQGQFEELLQATDVDLFAWLLGSLPPPNAEVALLLQKIREYVPCKSL